MQIIFLIRAGGTGS